MSDTPSAPTTRTGPSGTKRTTKGWFMDTGWRHIVGLAVLCFSLFPALWVISASFSDTGRRASFPSAGHSTTSAR